MGKYFAPYELSVKLKELGFDEECFGYYTGDKKDLILRPNMSRKNEIEAQYISAPLWEQAFKFFREKYNLFEYIEPSFDCIKLGYQNFSWLIKLQERVFIKDGTFKTYEEARLECLKKLIKIAENNNN